MKKQSQKAKVHNTKKARRGNIPHSRNPRPRSTDFNPTIALILRGVK